LRNFRRKRKAPSSPKVDASGDAAVRYRCTLSRFDPLGSGSSPRDPFIVPAVLSTCVGTLRHNRQLRRPARIVAEPPRWPDRQTRRRSRRVPPPPPPLPSCAAPGGRGVIRKGVHPLANIYRIVSGVRSGREGILQHRGNLDLPIQSDAANLPTTRQRCAHLTTCR
jgi:hypothetical protein